MKNNIYKLFALVLSVGMITACELDDPEIEYAAVTELSGEWFVQYESQETDGSWTDLGWGYTTIVTSNTAENVETEMMVQDMNGVGLQYKVNVSGLSFSVTNGNVIDFNPAWVSDDPVNVMNGGVIQGGGLSTSGVVTDSIHFEVVQPDFDGTVYRISGVRRTGFLEDEH